MSQLEFTPQLRNTLRLISGLVYNDTEYEAIAQQVDTPLQYVTLIGQARTDWFNIINYWIQQLEAEEAKKKIIEILELIQEKFPNNVPLQQAIDWSYEISPSPDFDTNEWRNTSEDEKDTNEKIISKISTLLPIHYLAEGLRISKCVGRIEADNALGTGFLLKDNYILTNWHVIKNRDIANNAVIKFNYELSENGIPAIFQEFRFDISQATFFATSEEDDWSIIKLDGDANDLFGHIPIAPIQIEPEERVAIIQHPGGSYKQIGMHNNFVKYVDDNEIQYLTDTLPGSSGSPVFNKDWELVGIHNKGGYLREPSTNLLVFRNAGRNINKVLAGIQAASIGNF